MKYKDKTIYSSGDMANILGFNDYHRISNYLAKIKASYVIKQGNTRYFDEKTKDKVITYFNALSSKGLGESKKDRLIEELRNQLHDSDKEKNKMLEEQKKSYERLIQTKDDSISNLKETIQNLRKQQDISNEQIKELTIVTKQAQSLNLADKKPEQIKLLKNSDKENVEKNEEEPKHKGWLSKLFK